MTALPTDSPLAASSAVEPFTSSLEHVLAELERIDWMVRLQVWRARQQGSDDAFRGLTISDHEVDTALDLPLGAPPWAGVPLPPELAGVVSTIETLTQTIQARRRESRRRGIPLRLEWLAKTFDLTRFDIDVLLIALAPEIDLRYERLYAWLQDDVTRRRPSINLTLHLLCNSLRERIEARARFASGAPLLRHLLVSLFSDPPQTHAPLLTQCLKLDDRIAAFLQDEHWQEESSSREGAIDARLTSLAAHVRSSMRLEDLVLSTAVRDQLMGLVQTPDLLSREGLILHLYGPEGVGRETTASAVCHALHLTLLRVDCRALAERSTDKLEPLIHIALREARLLGAALHWTHFDSLWAPEKRSALDTLLRALGDWPGLLLFSGEAPWSKLHGAATDLLRQRRRVSIGLEAADANGRAELWARALKRDVHGQEILLAEDVEVGRIADYFRFTAGQIRDAAISAYTAAALRNPLEPTVLQPTLTMADLWAACRRHGTPHLGTLAQKVATPFTWDDLVMSKDRVDRLREVVHHMRYRSVVLEQWGFSRKLATGRGLTMLFAGAPGTGKTMAAGVVARELELDLYQVDLSSVVSKYIGETEKHLARIFDEAERSQAVLFFDEADALFGKRSEVRDAHDRYANVETSYLLQRVEAYDGVVILASNFARNLDEAFVRRIRFILEFALPDEKERRRIWEQIWPVGVPRAEGLDLNFMAKRFELTGGYIRNIALSAAFLAAAEGGVVNLQHLLHATRREYQKMGKMPDDAMFLYKR